LRKEATQVGLVLAGLLCNLCDWHAMDAHCILLGHPPLLLLRQRLAKEHVQSPLHAKVLNTKPPWRWGLLANGHCVVHLPKLPHGTKEGKEMGSVVHIRSCCRVADQLLTIR
jgi:hypothetical protein